jgi:hypothetical protein
MDLLELEVLSTEEYKSNVDLFMKEYLYDFTKDELFSGLSNEDIKSLKFEEKVYEIPQWYPQRFKTKLDFSLEQSIGVCVSQRFNDNFIKIGTIDYKLKDRIIGLYSKEDIELICYLNGGRYKLATLNPDGSEKLKTYREDYSFKIAFRKKATVIHQPNNSNKLENIGENIQKTGNAIQQIGCFIFGLPLGIFCLYMIFKIITM